VQLAIGTVAEIREAFRLSRMEAAGATTPGSSKQGAD